LQEAAHRRVGFKTNRTRIGVCGLAWRTAATVAGPSFRISCDGNHRAWSPIRHVRQPVSRSKCPLAQVEGGDLFHAECLRRCDVKNVQAPRSRRRSVLFTESQCRSKYGRPLDGCAQESAICQVRIEGRYSGRCLLVRYHVAEDAKSQGVPNLQAGR